MKKVLIGLAVLSAGVLSSCGGSSPAPPAPTTAALTQAQLQSAYKAAADAYNNTEASLSTSESTNCDPTNTAADLGLCQTALNQDLQANLTFDKAIRAIRFPASDSGDVRKFLTDETVFENDLKEAAAASSITAVGDLASKIGTDFNATSVDLNALTKDIGLTSSPSASASASPASALFPDPRGATMTLSVNHAKVGGVIHGTLAGLTPSASGKFVFCYVTAAGQVAQSGGSSGCDINGDSNSPVGSKSFWSSDASGNLTFDYTIQPSATAFVAATPAGDHVELIYSEIGNTDAQGTRSVGQTVTIDQ